MTDIAIVRVTFADWTEAERIAEVVIDEQLAACVNVEHRCRSIYRWQGKVERSVELPALFKTTLALAQPLADRIAALHGHDLPAIEIWPVAVAVEIADWVATETDARPSDA
ncbi:divalent-cation tolerance protein CutA [Sphingomonas sp. AX6]|uniref:divalent-cation tolerance protein CutA n=1 Tax=Sphingomonas sp. AX6 TaxID=2653171 RepID=UPI0012EFF42A|nr:divalent-cation tolerance protein CutA [Sphingomonas sp. AX6]VXC74415.1 Periplasmic divalent cation tolerance protein cutA [Sphingomonas sp. AX6]